MTNANHVFDVFIKTIGQTKSLKISACAALALRSLCSYCGEQENRTDISKAILAQHSLQSRAQLKRSLISLRSKRLIDYKDSFEKTFGYRVEVKVMQKYITEGINKVALGGRLQNRSLLVSDFDTQSRSPRATLYKNKLKEKLTEKGVAQKEGKERKEERSGWTPGDLLMEKYMSSLKQTLGLSVVNDTLGNGVMAGIDENVPKDVIIESTDIAKNNSSGDGS